MAPSDSFYKVAGHPGLPFQGQLRERLDGENIAEMGKDHIQAVCEHVTNMATVSTWADHTIGKGSLISLPDTS